MALTYKPVYGTSGGLPLRWAASPRSGKPACNAYTGATLTYERRCPEDDWSDDFTDNTDSTDYTYYPPQTVPPGAAHTKTYEHDGSLEIHQGGYVRIDILHGETNRGFTVQADYKVWFLESGGNYTHGFRIVMRKGCGQCEAMIYWNSLTSEYELRVGYSSEGDVYIGTLSSIARDNWYTLTIEYDDAGLRVDPGTGDATVDYDWVANGERAAGTQVWLECPVGYCFVKNASLTMGDCDDGSGS